MHDHHDHYDQRPEPSSWHLDKRVSLAVIIVLFTQTFSSAWWASKISTDIDHLKNTVEIVMKDRYTAKDAERDQKLIDHQFMILNKWVDDHEDDHDKPVRR